MLNENLKIILKEAQQRSQEKEAYTLEFAKTSRLGPDYVYSAPVTCLVQHTGKHCFASTNSIDCLLTGERIFCGERLSLLLINGFKVWTPTKLIDSICEEVLSTNTGMSTYAARFFFKGDKEKYLKNMQEGDRFTYIKRDHDGSFVHKTYTLIDGKFRSGRKVQSIKQLMRHKFKAWKVSSLIYTKKQPD